MLTLNDGRTELWQWDTGRTLAVDADCSQVHFSNKVFGRSIDVDVTDGVAIIPDILLQTDKDLNVWAFVGTSENGYTKISKTFKVNRRNKPADYVFTPQEQITLKDATAILEEAKDVSNKAIESAKQAEDSSTQAAKSAADADRTANSIKDSMAQISENKEAVNQIKGDLSDKVQKKDYAPETKTESMTQPVGKDENGKLWTTVPEKVSAFENDAGYLTEHQDISGKLDADKLPEAVNDALEQAKISGEFDGAAGRPGENGTDGYSPSANVTQNDNGATITITDKNGITTATVTNGKDGHDGSPGKDGVDGQPGKDGASPVISVSSITCGHRITITDANGTKTVDVMDGSDGKNGSDGQPGADGNNGQDGSDGVGIQSVVQTTTSTEDGGTNVVTVTKTDGTSSTFAVRNGSRGSVGPAGADGKDGAPGADGKTPEYGVDYGTPEQIAEIAQKAAATATANSFFGVEFTGSTSAGVRTGAAADFVFTPGTDTDAGANSFDAVYPWAGMRRCCCTLNADGTVRVNAYKGQPGYIEDGTNGEVLVEVPLFYVAGAIDVDPRISNMKMPGYRVPKKFLNPDSSVKQRCYVRAFPGSIGEDGKLHSIAGAVPTSNTNISQFLAAARLWGDKYGIGTSKDFEVLAYLMTVVYGTRHFQSKINGVVSLYATNVAITGARDAESAVTVAKGVLDVGNVISIGTGGENESIARRRIVTAIEAIDGDATNVKAVFSGDPVTTTTDHKIWRIFNATGTANSVVSTCGSPVSNTDGRHSFVFYGCENPLYGNQWRFEADWKLIDGVPYYCDDPTKYQWSSAADYLKLDTLELPSDGYVTALQADERVPQLQITKSVGGSVSTYLADYFWINKSGVRIARRGGSSNEGGSAGPWCVYLNSDPSRSGWNGGADLSVPG